MQTPALRNLNRPGVKVDAAGEAVYDNPMDQALYQKLKAQAKAAPQV